MKGHYFIPNADAELTGVCIPATAKKAKDGKVDLVVHTADGPPGTRANVAFEAPSRDGGSFHESADCPWDRDG